MFWCKILFIEVVEFQKIKICIWWSRWSSPRDRFYSFRVFPGRWLFKFFQSKSSNFSEIKYGQVPFNFSSKTKKKPVLSSTIILFPFLFFLIKIWSFVVSINRRIIVIKIGRLLYCIFDNNVLFISSNLVQERSDLSTEQPYKTVIHLINENQQFTLIC